MYLDINLLKTVGTADPAAITNTKEMVTIVIDIPQELQGSDRVFSVIRVHDGVPTELKDMDNDPKTVTIQTDRFSTYALVYAEPDVVLDVPTFGDNFPIIPMLATMAMCLFGICSCVVLKKKY